MITLHWTRLLGAAICVGARLFVGVLWRLPYDQASNLFILFVGLLVGLIGIAASFWTAARDRELKLAEIRTVLGEVQESLTVLRVLT